MAYVTRDKIVAEINGPQLIKMLDDDRDGNEDPGLLDSVIAAASEDIDGRLSTTYATPFADPAPNKVQAAALIMVCEALYARRNVPAEVNPFKLRADYWRERLDEIGRDGRGLDFNTARQFQAIGEISTASFIDDNSL